MTETTTRVRGWRCALWYGLTLALAALSFLSVSCAAVEGKLMRIDTHSHYLPPFYFDLLTANRIKAGGLDIPKWNVIEHLEFMDAFKIQLAILSVSTPCARLPPFDVQEGRTLARKLNDYGHMLVVSHPSRFQFFATLTLPDVEGSIAEAIYSLDTLKAAGVVLLANSQGEYLGSKNLDPLMEVLNTRKATVFIHPTSLDVAPVSNDSDVDEDIPPFVIDFLLDTTRAAANLAFKNVTGRYPDIKFLLSHSGGFLPFDAYRLGGALSMINNGRMHDFEVLNQLRSFYVDTALASSPSAFPSTLAFIPHNQITFGTDYPFAPTNVISINTEHLDIYPLVEEEMHMINFGNAYNILEKPLSHWRSIWHLDGTCQFLGPGQQDSPHAHARGIGVAAVVRTIAMHHMRGSSRECSSGKLNMYNFRSLIQEIHI